MLTKNDVDKLMKAIDARFELHEAKEDKKFDSLTNHFDGRFVMVENRLDRVEEKLDRLIKTEDEDIRAVFKDIDKLKAYSHTH